MKNQKGFTFIEVLLAMAIFTFLSIGSLNLFSNVSREGDRVMTMTGRNIENEQMTERLSQPVYFGLLAGFPENTALKECITADNKLCDVSVDYPLTAMNLSTKEKIEYISGSLAEGMKNTLTFRVHCPLGQNTCDQADYFIVKVQTQVTKTGEAPFTIEKTAMVVPDITNIATFIPDAEMSPGRKINIVFFIDTSNSMAYAKSKIKTGLKSILDTVETMNAVVSVYDLAMDSNVLASDKNPPIYYTLAGDGTKTIVPDFKTLPIGTTVYSQTNPVYDYRSVWTAGLAGDQYSPVNMDPADSDALKALKSKALDDRIEWLFANASDSEYDMPMCQLMMMIDNNDPRIPINSETPTVMLLISNENDDTTLMDDLAGKPANALRDTDCYKSATAKSTVTSTDTLYWGLKKYYNYNLKGEFLLDGAPFIGDFATHVALNSYAAGLPKGTDCSSTTVAMTSQIKDAVDTSPTKPYPGVYPGTYTGNIIDTNQCIVEDIEFHMGGFADPNMCNHGHEAFWSHNFPGYKANSCYSTPPEKLTDFNAYYTSTPYIGWSTQEYVNQDTPLAVYNNLAAHGAAKNFFFVPIIHTLSNAATCALTTGATYGTNYERLATLLGDQAEVVSICNEDYSGKLKSLTEGFMKVIGASDIALPMSVAASIKSIEIVRGDTVIKPIKDQDYHLYNTTLQFTYGYLLPTDIVKVYTQ